MALPSQTRHPLVRRHTQMGRRHRPGGRRKVFLGALLLLVVALGAIRLALPGRPETPAGTDGETASTPPPATEFLAAAATDTIVATPDPKQAAVGQPDAEEARHAVVSDPPAPRRPARQSPLATPSGAQEVMGPPRPRSLEAALALADTDRPVEARSMLTAILASGTLDAHEADLAREAVGILNQRLLFSPEIVAGDPFARSHVVASGEHLAGIVEAESLQVDWRFIMRINRIAGERSLRAGHRLKLITGPFHAIVYKSAYRLDLYLGAGEDLVLVACFPVGVGQYNSTPVGLFRVRPHSKLVNPAWANPRTGERFDADDPANPIGDRWIGLQGLDEATRDLAGYGIHGTIEPHTIGTQASMGCVRMLPEDVEIVYEVLMEGVSRVEIRP